MQNFETTPADVGIRIARADSSQTLHLSFAEACDLLRALKAVSRNPLFVNVVRGPSAYPAPTDITITLKGL